jgi:hypothetical protein
MRSITDGENSDSIHHWWLHCREPH